MSRIFLAVLAAASLLHGAAADAAPSKKPRHHKAAPAPKDKPPQAFADRPDLLAKANPYASDLAAAQGWSADELKAQLAQAQSMPVVQRLIMPASAGTAKNWGAYRARFVEQRRLQAGLAFWEQNDAALQRAEQQYGVPPQVIVGLIGVETFYGQIMGGFRVMDALSTLAFDFPSGRSDRSEFFRGELTEFLKLSHKEGIDPFSVKGSYAGAMGLPQFMPGSWNQYAVDFDGDGHVDLSASPADAIGSVANYLAEHGWQRGMPTDYAVTLPASAATRARLLKPDIKPSFSVPELRAAGVRVPEAALQQPGLLAVIELQNGRAAPSHVLGTENFYVLTRYNWSAYYAMAVIELGRTLNTLREAGR